MINLWEQCLNRLRDQVNEHTFLTWLAPVLCERISNEEITLSAPNNFFIAWIKDHHLPLISETLFHLTGKDFTIDFISRGDSNFENLESQDSCDPSGITNFNIHTDKFVRKRNLNPRYTFDSFVVGSCNQFAHAAARSVSENLGGSYNPLFIYGSVGLGKTHLMSAIGYSIAIRDRTKNIAFVTSEEFTNEMINAIRFDRMVDFRNKYRKLDLLMIDDIQFIAGKERTQEEFFHTFNSIYESSKQIVITSDRFPNEISDMEHRLRSRFSWGLIADMSPPDLETKVAILKRKSFEDSFDLPDDVAYFLAEQVESNIRELVGYLIRVIAMSSLQGIPISTDLAKLALREILHRNTKNITIEDIISHVAKSFNIKTADLKSKKKHKLYSLPRQVGMYLARNLTDRSYPEIGAAFGGKDHSTVIYGAKKIEKRLETDNSLKTMLEALRKDIRGI
ncbi:MAG: chromosomal replication initiator protein DnaA [Deltaproteobacteria bacterium]|nr:chromosomal replication initiator protein DnaA [Deltaproteobacteria bacterium]